MANIPRYIVAVYWGGRAGPLIECGSVISHLILALAGVDPAFENWFETGWSRKRALEKSVLLDAEYIARRLSPVSGGRRSTRTDVTSIDGLDPLGYGLGLWTGRGDLDSAGMMVFCNSPAPLAGMQIANSCILSLTFPSVIASRRLLNRQLLRNILVAMITAWNPIYGWALPDHFLGLLVPRRGMPAFGWLTHLRVPNHDVLILPRGFVVDYSDGDNYIIGTAENWTEIDDDRRLALSRELSRWYGGLDLNKDETA